VRPPPGCIGQQLTGELRRGRLDKLRALFRLAGVDAHHEMEMQRPATLVLRHLHIRDPRPLPQPPLRRARQPGELARDLDRRSPPQLWGQRIPDHGLLVVEAVRAERLAEPRIIRVVDLAAGQTNTMPAHRRVPPRTAPQRLAVALAGCVDRPERRSRQRRKHRRMSGHRFGDTLAAAKPCGDELERVTAVDLGAARADRLTPVAATLQQRLVRLASGREHGAHLAGRDVDRLRSAVKPDRPAAVPGGP
jgi:hypothetical protein